MTESSQHVRYVRLNAWVLIIAAGQFALLSGSTPRLVVALGGWLAFAFVLWLDIVWKPAARVIDLRIIEYGGTLGRVREAPQV